VSESAVSGDVSIDFPLLFVGAFNGAVFE